MPLPISTPRLQSLILHMLRIYSRLAHFSLWSYPLVSKRYLKLFSNSIFGAVICLWQRPVYSFRVGLGLGMETCSCSTFSKVLGSLSQCWGSRYNPQKVVWCIESYVSNSTEIQSNKVECKYQLWVCGQAHPVAGVLSLQLFGLFLLGESNWEQAIRKRHTVM